jgi:hypothetical protein
MLEIDIVMNEPAVQPITDSSFFDEIPSDEEVLDMPLEQLQQSPAYQEELKKEQERLKALSIKPITDSSFFDEKPEVQPITNSDFFDEKPKVQPITNSDFFDEVTGVSTEAIADLNNKGHTPAYAYEFNPYEEENTWGAAVLAGLNNSTAFNLSREVRATFDADTLNNYNWLFGRAWKGDNPYTEEKEEGWNFISTLEEMNIDEETWDNMPHNERLVRLNKGSQDWIKHNNNPDTNRTAYTVAKFGGMLLDPSILVPLKSPKQFMAFGASDASLYEHSTTGKVSPTTPLLGAGLAYAGYKGGQLIVGKITEKQADKVLKELQNEINRITISEQLNPFEALKLAKNNLGLTDQMVNEALKIQNKKWTKKGENKLLLQMPRNRQEAVKLIEAQSKVSEVRMGSKTNVGEVIDRIIEPISEGIKRLSPRLFGHVQRFEAQQYQNAHKYASMVEPFLERAFGSLSPKAIWVRDKLGRLIGKPKSSGSILNAERQAELKHLMLNSSTKEDAKALDSWILKYGGERLAADWRVYRAAMDEIHALRVSAGNDKLTKLYGYSPRRLVDFKMWQKNASEETRGALGAKIKEYKKKNKIPKTEELSEKQLNDVISSFLKSTNKKNIRTAGSSKARSKHIISPAQAKAYADPWAASHSYIRESMEEITRLKVFGKKNIAKDGDINTTISNFLTGQMKQGLIKNKDIDALKKLLELRYVDGPRTMSKALTTAKDIGYMSLLGSPTNAIRQASDIAFSTYFNGYKNAIKGVYSTLTKKLLTPKEMGLLDNTAAEFAHDTMSKRAVDFTFKYTGFRAVDALGKGTLVNSTLHKMAQLSKSKAGESKFMNKWSAFLGADDAMRALKEFNKFSKGEITKPTQLMKEIGFMELTKVQPLTLLEMPHHYLRMTNGRMFYMLRSFQLKHINLMRQEGIKRIREGDVIKGGKNLAAITSMFVAANLPITMAIDYMLGRDSKDIEEMLVTEMWRASSLLSKWDADKLMEGNSMYEQFWDMAKPPVDRLYDASEDLVKMGYNFVNGENIFRTEGKGKETGEALINMAPFGNLVNAWFID